MFNKIKQACFVFHQTHLKFSS